MSCRSFAAINTGCHRCRTGRTIRYYPANLVLLNEVLELSERILNKLHAKSNRLQKKKPRTYREIARKIYLSLVKLR